MAIFSIEILDKDESTVVAALAFNAGYRSFEEDGDQKEFAVNSLIDYIKAIVRAVAVNEIKITNEIVVKQNIEAIPEVVIVNKDVTEVKDLKATLASG